MPGLLSELFQSNETQDTQQSNASHSNAGFDADFAPAVHVDSDMGGSYQGVDGSQSDWSSENDVTLTADVGASSDASMTLLHESMSQIE